MPIDWLATAPDWTRFLREQGFRLSVGDDLRVAALGEHLRSEAVPLGDAEAAARWYGPVICRTADERDRLARLLGRWEDEQRPGGPPSHAAVETHALAPLRRLSWSAIVARLGILAAIWLAIVAGIATIYVFSHEPAPAAAPAPAIERQEPVRTPTDRAGFERKLVAASFAVAPVVLLFVVGRRRRRDIAVLIRGLAPQGAPTVPLRINVASMDLYRTQPMTSAAADLRRHRFVPAEWIDGARSARATVAAGGRVHLVKAMRPATPEHLLLVDVAGANDILGLVADLVAARLREGQVKVDRFDYHGDPRRLRRIDENGARAEAVDLEALRGCCPDHRVVILSDAAAFADGGGESTRSWVDELRQWSDVAVVTPIPAAQWGPRERTLIRLGFHVVEATPKGLADLGRQFRKDLPLERGTPSGARVPRLDQRFDADSYRWLGDASPAPREILQVVADLKAVLSADAFLYLAALAVFPVVHPKLTVGIGRILANGHGQPLLSEANLAMLCRVPWLRHGRIPEWLRLALVRDLAGRAEEADRVRAAWTALLEPRDSEDAATLPVNVVDRSPRTLTAWVARILADAPSHREAILLAFLRREELPELATQLPQRLAKMLKGRERGYWAWPLGALAAAALGVVLVDPLDDWLTATKAAWLPGPSVASLDRALSWLAPAMANFALFTWYMPRLLQARWDPARLSALAQRARWTAIGSAFAAMLALYASAAFRPLDTILLGQLILLGTLLALVSEKQDEGALGWTPAIIVGNLWLAAPGIFLGLLLLPLFAWVASRHSWAAMRQAMLYASPAYLLGVPLASDVRLIGNFAGLLALWLIARLICDERFRSRTLDCGRLGAREIAVLLLPLSLTIFIDLEVAWIIWFPEFALVTIVAVIGFTSMRIAPLVVAIVLCAFLMFFQPAWNLTLMGNETMFSFGRLDAAISALLALGCARAASLAMKGKTGCRRLLPPLVIIAFAGSAIVVHAGSLSGTREFSSPLVAPHAVVAVATIASFALSSRALWSFLALGVGILAMYTASQWLFALKGGWLSINALGTSLSLGPYETWDAGVVVVAPLLAAWVVRLRWRRHVQPPASEPEVEHRIAA